VLPLRGKILNVEKARDDKILSSDEIKTMITALGTGYGREDFDVAKLRYHKLIIMCDADVDGAHIRTLILTFFFRQMREIIDRGHLYIAQPPLYKVAHGKAENYLKDDREYQRFLLERIQDSWEMTVAGNGDAGSDQGPKKLRGQRLAAFVEKVENFRENLAKLTTRGYPADALRAVLQHGIRDKKALTDAAKVKEVAEIIEASGFHRVSVGHDEEHGTGFIAFTSKRDGVEREVRIGWSLVTSVEYRALAQNQQGLEALGARGFTLARVEEGKTKSTDPSEHESIEEALETLYGAVKKGLTIQRYKGLGEMNPSQLWETTMDPEKRRLLQVRIEDAVEADSIFTVLMGDQVEPRREFIEKNALEVRNLDI